MIVEGERMLSFNRVQAKILSFLIESTSPLHSRDLSERVGVSTRSVKKSIGEINDILRNQSVSICSGTHQGYWINEDDKQKFSEIMHQQTAVLLKDDPDHRLIFEGMHLLARETPMTVQKLSETLSISRATVSSDYSRLKEIASAAKGVRLYSHKSGGYVLTGKESAIRHFYASLVSLYYGPNQRYLKHAVAEIFHMNTLMNAVHDFLAMELLKEDIVLTDRAMTIFTLEVLFAAYRFSVGMEIELTPDAEWKKPPYCSSLVKYLGMKLPDSELFWIDKRLASYRYLELDLINLSADQQLVRRYLEDLDRVYGTRLVQNRKLNDYLIMIQHYDQEPIQNEDFSVTDHPFAKMLTDRFNTMLEKDGRPPLSEGSQISLTALYFVLLNENVGRLRVAVVSEETYAQQEYLVHWLSTRFGYYLDVVAVYPLYSIVQTELFSDVDFCICTSQKLLKTTYSASFRKIPCDIICISPALSYTDFRVIEHYIHDRMPSRSGLPEMVK
ncbi:MAG: HTH domain-containing protein [Galactobacillus timonensis]|uniref:BglG family transcription antiterminator n=1 Tax=Galactobacillus timonensis TaxID=2041840 RepID=UPI0023F07536|nr:HTH domain-containing protein [Galactobacillus timonensis]MCI6066718.1 HTH domain-containing protein [Galactobacillus timonensis]